MIDDAYNATPVSMAAGLRYLAKAGRKINSRVAILGDIAHLGEKEVEFHIALSSVLAEVKADRVLLCGPLMKHLWEKIQPSYQDRTKWFESGKALLPELNQWLKAGDTVFIKGSTPANLQLLVDELTQSKGM